MDQPKWEWVDTVFGLIAGVIATVGAMLAWMSPKLMKLEQDQREMCDEMEQKIDAVDSRVRELSEEVAVLTAHEEAARDRLKTVELKQDRLENQPRERGPGGNHRRPL